MRRRTPPPRQGGRAAAPISAASAVFSLTSAARAISCEKRKCARHVPSALDIFLDLAIAMADPPMTDPAEGLKFGCRRESIPKKRAGQVQAFQPVPYPAHHFIRMVCPPSKHLYYRDARGICQAPNCEGAPLPLPSFCAPAGPSGVPEEVFNCKKSSKSSKCQQNALHASNFCAIIALLYHEIHSEDI